MNKPDLEFLRKELSEDELKVIRDFANEDVIMYLRQIKKWPLWKVGMVFGVTAQYICQIDDSNVDARKHRERDFTVDEEELGLILGRAARTPEAWTDNGQLSRTWMAEQLGLALWEYDKAPNRPGGFGKKVEILLYGLGIVGSESIKEWYDKHYWQFGMGFEDIARYLSNLTGVSVHYMSAYRYFAKVCLFETRNVGTKGGYLQ